MRVRYNPRVTRNLKGDVIVKRDRDPLPPSLEDTLTAVKHASQFFKQGGMVCYFQEEKFSLCNKNKKPLSEAEIYALKHCYVMLAEPRCKGTSVITKLSFMSRSDMFFGYKAEFLTQALFEAIKRKTFTGGEPDL